MVEVTQEDRELFIATLNPCDSVAESVRKGTSFTWEVQQIARHRIAAEQRGKLEGARLALEAAAGVCEARIMNDLTDEDAELKRCADIIAALDPAKIVGEG